MKINIHNVKNVQKIVDYLAKINGKAIAHTITNEIDIEIVADRAEKDMATRGLAKKHRVGASVTYTPSGPGKAYSRKGRYIITTTIELKRYASGWFLTGAHRAEIYADANERYAIHVDEKQMAIMQAHVFSKFLVHVKI